MSRKEKFSALAAFRKRQAKREASRDKENARKRLYRERHPKPPKAKPFIPPNGYCGGQELAKRLEVDYSTVKRWKRLGLLREFRVDRRVAYCEYDAICAKENSKLIKQANGQFTSALCKAKREKDRK